MEHFEFLVFSYFIFTLVLNCYSTLTTVDTTQGKKKSSYYITAQCTIRVHGIIDKGGANGLGNGRIGLDMVCINYLILFLWDEKGHQYILHGN